MIYLTSNPDKMHEAKEFLRKNMVLKSKYLTQILNQLKYRLKHVQKWLPIQSRMQPSGLVKQ